MLKDQFSSVLRDFGLLFQEDLALDEYTDTAVIAVDDDVLVNVQYLNESDTVVLFSPVGGLPQDDEQAGEKALSLLKLTDLSGACGEITLMLDEDAGLVLAADRRSVLKIATVDELAAWVKIVVNAVRSTREYFAEHFPVEEEQS